MPDVRECDQEDKGWDVDRPRHLNSALLRPIASRIHEKRKELRAYAMCKAFPVRSNFDHPRNG